MGTFIYSKGHRSNEGANTSGKKQMWGKDKENMHSVPTFCLLSALLNSQHTYTLQTVKCFSCGWDKCKASDCGRACGDPCHARAQPMRFIPGVWGSLKVSLPGPRSAETVPQPMSVMTVPHPRMDSASTGQELYLFPAVSQNLKHYQSQNMPSITTY